MLYSRRCLEVIITDLCEQELKRPRRTEPLKGIIDKLHHEEKVPAYIITSMHGLNDLATFGAHPKEFDPQQVRPVLINLTTIIRWYLKYKDSQTIGEVKTEGQRHDIKTPFVSGQIIRKPKISLILLLSGILVVVTIIAYYKIFRQDRLEKLRSSGERISVAVMPFQNMTNDTTWDIWQDGIQNELISSLTNAGELKVRQTASTNSLIHEKGLTDYASITPSLARNISQRLDVDVFVYGTIKEAGKSMRVNAQLIDSKTGDIFKSFQINGHTENIIDMIDSLSAGVRNFLIISVLEKSFKLYKDVSTDSPEALKYYIYGQNAFFKFDFKTAREWTLKAIEIDSNFVSADILLASTYADWLYNSSVDVYQEKKMILKLYEKRDKMSRLDKIIIEGAYASLFQTQNLTEGIKYYMQLLEIDDQQPGVYESLAINYLWLSQYDKSITNFKKAFEIYKKWGIKPRWVWSYSNFGDAYHKAGKYKKEKKLYKRAERDFPDSQDIISRQAILALATGNTKDANRYIEEYKSILKGNSISDADILINLGQVYYNAGIHDKAIDYLRQAIAYEPENANGLNILAWFLIDTDKNIKEGLDLVTKALELSPGTWYMLDTKGWGLYKQGKYREALDLIQKSWDLRTVYDYLTYLHLEAAKKAVAEQK